MLRRRKFNGACNCPHSVSPGLSRRIESIGFTLKTQYSGRATMDSHRHLLLGAILADLNLLQTDHDEWCADKLKIIYMLTTAEGDQEIKPGT